MPDPVKRRSLVRRGATFLSAVAMAFLVGCAPVDNPEGGSGHALCFAYYQQCVNPIFDTLLPIDFDNNGSIDATNTCAGAGCHDNTSGTGGAFRIIPNLTPVSLVDPAAIKGPPAMDMYKNFYSAQGATDVGSARESRLMTKPLVEVLHGGGRVFANAQDLHMQQILYWISNPAPQGKDEFCAECDALFVGGACKTTFP
jgi:hypothetical protein